MNKNLWELLEMEAPDKFYVNDAKKPAFLLFPPFHFASTSTSHSLYLNRVALIKRFASKKEALAHLNEIVETAFFPAKVYRTKRDEKVLFAENLVCRVDKAGLIGAHKVFDVKEFWRF